MSIPHLPPDGDPRSEKELLADIWRRAEALGYAPAGEEPNAGPPDEPDPEPEPPPPDADDPMAAGRAYQAQKECGVRPPRARSPEGDPRTPQPPPWPAPLSEEAF